MSAEAYRVKAHSSCPAGLPALAFKAHLSVVMWRPHPRRAAWPPRRRSAGPAATPSRYPGSRLCPARRGENSGVDRASPSSPAPTPPVPPRGSSPCVCAANTSNNFAGSLNASTQHAQNHECHFTVSAEKLPTPPGQQLPRSERSLRLPRFPHTPTQPRTT